MVKFKYEDIPRIGVGLSHRNEFISRLLENKTIDFLEIIAPRFDSGSSDFFKEIVEKYPIVLHELNLSIGSDEELDNEEFQRIVESSKRFKSIWVSDHLSMTSIEGIDLGHLTPIAYTNYMLDIISKKLSLIIEKLDRPFLLENITYFFEIPGSEMSEPEFLNRLFLQTGCFLLLDINNLFVNASNFGFNAYDYVDMIENNSIVEVHIGGAYCDNGIWIDSHGHSVVNEVWDLLEYVVDKHEIKAIVLERDKNLGNFNDILDELKIAKIILNSKNDDRSK